MSEKALKWSIIRFVITILVAVSLVVFLSLREGNTANELKEGLITNCEKNGNPLREVLQQRIHHEIEQTSNTDLLKKFFPSLTEQEIEQLAAEALKERREEIKQVAPVNCSEQYK